MKNSLPQPGWKPNRIGKLLFWNFCIVVLVIVGIYSCTDHENISDDTEISIDKPISMRSPATTADRVYFADYDEFEDYYLELEDIIENYDGDYFDSIVDLTTGVQTLNDVISFSTVGTSGHVSDLPIRAIVNANSEFQIDDILVTVINDSQWLLSDVSDGTLKSSIRGMTKGITIATTDIPTGAQWTAPYDLEESISKFWCGCRVFVEQFDCENIRVWGACSGFFGTNGLGDLLVTFDPDGLPGPNTIIDEEVQNNFEFIIDIDDFNGVAGIVDVVGDSHCHLETSPGIAEFYYDPEDFQGCDWKPRARQDTIQLTAASLERMICRTSFVKGVSDNHVAEVWSESRANVNSNWERTKRTMTVRVDANRQSGACEFLGAKDDEETRNRKHLVTRVVWYANCWHCDGDLVGGYVKGLLTHTRDLDFHCCEE